MTAAAHPLSDVEAESLRRLRTRMAKPAPGLPARQVLGKVFLETVARVGLDADTDAAPLPAPAALVAQVDAADLDALRRLCARMAHLRTTDAAAWSRLMDARVPGAVVSRRLTLAGRERDRSEAA